MTRCIPNVNPTLALMAIVAIAGSTHSLAAGPFPPTLSLSSLNGTNGFVLNGIDVEDYSGQSVSGIGDFNGDGIDDLLIGARYADPNGDKTGESYVVFGGAGVGAGGTIELSSLNGTNGFVLNGIDEDDLSGFSVSGLGDVNGDGTDDLIIGAYEADPNGINNSSESYVVFGGVGVGAGGTLELSSLNGANGFVINGIDSSDRSGSSVSGAGDVNGDGIDDILIGAYAADPNGSASGESYVVFGAVGVGAGGTLNLSTLNGANGFVLNGIDAGDRSGRSLSGAGDVNNDGIDDIIIGANEGDPNAIDSGESYVVFGALGIGAGGTLELSSLNGADGFVLNGIDADDRCGFSVSGAGDVNADGIDDLIIGANRADPNGNSSSGESYVVFGGVGIGAGGTVELSTLNGADGFVINGVLALDRSGCSVSDAGDINGDGIDDLIVGAYNADPVGTASGESYVLFGGTGFWAGGVVDLSTLNAGGSMGEFGFVLPGADPGDRSGRSVSGAGDINGDGIDDLIIGAYYAAPNGLGSGATYVVFGKSADTTLPADINGDGIVDTADLGILIGTFGQTSP